MKGKKIIEIYTLPLVEFLGANMKFDSSKITISNSDTTWVDPCYYFGAQNTYYYSYQWEGNTMIVPYKVINVTDQYLSIAQIIFSNSYDLKTGHLLSKKEIKKLSPNSLYDWKHYKYNRSDNKWNDIAVYKKSQP